MPHFLFLLLCCAILAACQAPVTAPLPAGETPTPAPSPLRYVAIGASDTVGEGASDPATRSWPALLSRRFPEGSTYVNVGVSGSTVAQALAQQLPRVRREPADVITIWLAVNDFNAGVEPEEYRDQLGALLRGLEPTGARVFVGTVPDLTLVPAYAEIDRALLDARIQAYNQAIAEAVAAHAGFAVLIDLHTGSDVIARESVVSEDGFHPSDRGYELIAQRFAETMRAHGLPIDC